MSDENVASFTAVKHIFTAVKHIFTAVKLPQGVKVARWEQLYYLVPSTHLVLVFVIRDCNTRKLTVFMYCR
jgi:hypothetical protein